jgi:hypothetical protein
MLQNNTTYFKQWRQCNHSHKRGGHSMLPASHLGFFLLLLLLPLLLLLLLLLLA